MKDVFERLELELQGRADRIAELQRIREAYEAGVNQIDDVHGFVKRLRFSGALDSTTAGSIEVDLLFEFPLDSESEKQKQPFYYQNTMIGANGPIDKEGMVWHLEQTIKDLRRQVTTEFRSRYFGECLAMHKTLAMIGWLDSAETDSLYLNIVKAHEQALAQCLAAGESVPDDLLQRESFRRQQAEERYVTGRAKLNSD